MLQIKNLYPLWEADKDYEKGEFIKYNERLYRVEQVHTSQSHQPPGSEGMLAIYRPVQESGKTLPWIYGEVLSIGDRRIDPTDNLIYEVYTESGSNIWEPHTAPSIWRVIEEEIEFPL